ncbi:MAG TPA: nucleoside hydrolase-like domain-containing protein [Lacipirellulaceae bacterium]|nr:nucleoside hydrolase-like domain-containing protein [Lacipirellulaceae bacterium]
MTLAAAAIASSLAPGAIRAAEAPAAPERPRILVLTDVSNEPDDEESLVRFLVYCNEFDVEGLVATTSVHLKTGPREDIIRRFIAAYGEVRPQLVRHGQGYPPAEALLEVACTGQAAYGMEAVGDGKLTAGAQRILDAADRDDDRPLWISVWGGANTLAQALHEARATRDAAEVAALVQKLRVYTISDQDDAGAWIRREFPQLFYIAAPGNVGGSDYWRATWTGISGDRHYGIGVGHRFEMVDNPWLTKHVAQGHGPLGALYPKVAYIMEGDTPAFLGLVDNGLAWRDRPDYGGWGGRYGHYRPYGEPRAIWTETRASRDTVTSDDNGRTETSHHATIWRWREHYQNDFAARMDWCVAAEFDQANHNPHAVLNGDSSKSAASMTAKQGETVRLSAEGSTDPDNDELAFKWWVYREAGDFPGEISLLAVEGPSTSFVAPPVKKPATVHVILEVRDAGTPNLWAYRRAIVTIAP